MIESVDTIKESSEQSVLLKEVLSVSKMEVEPLTNSEPVVGENELTFPPDNDVLDMMNGVNVNDPLPIVTERYFTPYYRINYPKKGDDICIRLHTNRLCMISLAPSHAIFNSDRKIEKIDFQVTDKLNRADNAVSGKAKHGAQPLHETSKICSITCSDGQTWIVRCGMNGKLTEANTDLIENPELLRQPPHKGGYLAIVLPKLDAPEKMKQYLMTQQAYDDAIRDRLSVNIENGAIRANGAVKRPHDDESLPDELKEKIVKTEDDRKVVGAKVDSSDLSCT